MARVLSTLSKARVAIVTGWLRFQSTSTRRALIISEEIFALLRVWFQAIGGALLLGKAECHKMILELLSRKHY